MHCPHCGQANPATAQNCIRCGQLLPRPSSAPAMVPILLAGGTQPVVPPMPNLPPVPPPITGAPWGAGSPAAPFPPRPMPPAPAGIGAPYGYGGAVPVLIPCRVCGATLAYGSAQCARCTTPYASIADPNDPTCTKFIALDGRQNAANTSGDPKGLVPPEAQKICGGALMPLTAPFWCMANGVPLGVVLLILGLVGLVYPWIFALNIAASLVLGIRGGPLAWQRRKWADVARFQVAQQQWNRAALILGIAAIIIVVIVSLS